MEEPVISLRFTWHLVPERGPGRRGDAAGAIRLASRAKRQKRLAQETIERRKTLRHLWCRPHDNIVAMRIRLRHLGLPPRPTPRIRADRPGVIARPQTERHFPLALRGMALLPI